MMEWFWGTRASSQQQGGNRDKQGDGATVASAIRDTGEKEPTDVTLLWREENELELLTCITIHSEARLKLKTLISNLRTVLPTSYQTMLKETDNKSLIFGYLHITVISDHRDWKREVAAIVEDNVAHVHVTINVGTSVNMMLLERVSKSSMVGWFFSSFFFFFLSFLNPQQHVAPVVGKNLNRL